MLGQQCQVIIARSSMPGHQCQVQTPWPYCLDTTKDLSVWCSCLQELPNLRPECLRVLEVATTLLMRSAAAGLTLADIGALASRPLDALDDDDSCPSALEKACIAARQVGYSMAPILWCWLGHGHFLNMASEGSAFAVPSSGAAFAAGMTARVTCRSAAAEQRNLSYLWCASCLPSVALVMQAAETRELTSMLSSSLSSSDGAFAFKEEDEEGIDSSEIDNEPGTDSVDAGCNVSYKPPSPQQQHRPRSPSRLGTMCSGSADPCYGSDEAAAMAVSSDGTTMTIAAPRASSDLASVISNGAALTIATAMSLGSKGAPEADFLFDLDEDSSSSAANTPASNSGKLSEGKQQDEPMTGPLRPAFGSGSVSSMDAEQLSARISGVRLLTDTADVGTVMGARAVGLSVRTADVPPTGSSALISPPPVHAAAARSVHMGDGWMFRGLKPQAAAALMQRCSVNGAKKGVAGARRRTGLQGAMYPPPVVRAAPRSANEVLSGLSGEQWAAFMAELELYMDEALRPGVGSWRRASEAAGFGGAALSCPRF